MNVIHTSTRLKRELEEHLQLLEMMLCAEAAVANRRASRTDVREILRCLGDDLLAHFDHEEADDGCFEEALIQAPRFRLRASKLLREHFDLRMLFFAVEHLAARSIDDGDTWWAALESRLSEFVKRFVAHEAAENDLLHAAYCEDLGGGA